MIPDELEDKIETALNSVLDRIIDNEEQACDIPGLVGSAIHLFDFKMRVVLAKSEQMGETDKTNH